MMSTRFAPVHVATCILIITFGISVYCESERKFCDVKLWHRDLVRNGPLSGDLTEEQIVLRETIQKMVNKYNKVGRADGMVDCSILTVYEDLLKADDKPPDTHSAGDAPDGDPIVGKDKSAQNINSSSNKEKEQTTDQSQNIPDSSSQDETDQNPSEKASSYEDRKGNLVEDANADDNTDKNNSADDDGDDTDIDETDFGDDDEENNNGVTDLANERTEHKNEQVQDKTSEGKEVSSGKEDQSQTSKGEHTVEESGEDHTSDDHSAEDLKTDSQTEKRNGKRMVEELVFDPLKGYVKVLKEAEDDKDKETDENDEAETTDDQNKHAKDTEEQNKDDLKEQQDEDTVEDDKDEHGDKKKDSLEQEKYKEDNGQTKQKTRMVEKYVFDPHKGYIKVITEVEVDPDEDEEAPEDRSEKDAAAQDEQSQSEEEEETQKTSQDDTNTQTSDETEDRVSEKKEEANGQKSKDEEDKDQERNDSQTMLEIIKQKCLQRHLCDIYCYYGYSSRQCLDNYPDLPSKVISEQNSVASVGNVYKLQGHTTDTVSKTDKQDNDDSKHHISGSHKSETEEGRRRSHSETHAETVKTTNGDGHMSGTRQSEETSEKRMNTDKHSEQEPTKDTMRQDFRDFTADLHRFELTFQQRASEYANKIQNLEIMIIKLENQLLGERLNKQNSTSSFSKLENHILRLENELLKLNQSYAYLKEENDVLKSRQRKYLELGHDKQTSMNDSSAKHYELISKQQSKISELSSLLLNHTELFDKLHSRSQTLEGQNQALYQIVMNQTALISSIMKKMQELSEENLRQRQETQDLKAKLEMKSNSDRLLEKLDNLVSGRAPVTTSVVDDGQPEKKEKLLNIHIFFPRSPDAAVAKKPWTCNGNKSSRFCLLYSLILSPCPPSSTIYWGKCPYFFKDISKQQDAKTETVNNEKMIDGVHINVNKDEGNIQERNLSSSNKNDDQNEAMVMTQREESIKDTGANLPVDDQTGSSLLSSKETDNSPHDSAKEEDSSEKDESAETSRKESHEKDGEDVRVKDEPSSKSDEHKHGDEHADGFRANDAVSKRSSDYDTKEAPDVPKEAPDVPKEVPDVPKSTSVPKEAPDVPKLTPATKEASGVPASEQAPATSPEDRKLLYTSEKEPPKPKDCYGYYLNGATRNGMYKIYVIGLEKNLPVYCDIKGGGWTILLKRSSGGVDFYKDWDEYKRGFGALYSEHWIGNDNLHYITNQDHYRLRVELKDTNREEVHAEYDTFWTDNEDEAFRLHIGGYSGTAGDGFAKHNNMKFSTKDTDNDLVSKELKEYDNSCAKRFHSGWWYYKCYMSNLTGQYYRNGVVPDKSFDGVSWKPWKKPNISLKEAVMKIRPLNAKD